MNPAIPILGLVAALFVAAVFRKPDQKGRAERNTFGSIRETDSNDRSTRRTIAVNLSILLPELDELETIAAHAKPSAQVERAKELLQQAREVTEPLDWQLKSASSQELGNILEVVFAAMSGSTDARRLLGACHTVH
jgi:hypothetical protein